MKQLREKSAVIPETYELITLMFSDIPGFPLFVAQQTPLAVTLFLRDLDEFFQKILPRFDVYEIESISDSHMVSNIQPFSDYEVKTNLLL